MIELVFWGTIIILTTSISAIGVVLGIYFMLTKNKKKETKNKRANYKIEDQKEIT